MNSIKIIIDNREKDLIKLIQKSNSFTIELENLDIGDIIIYYNDQIVFIIERKTQYDLAASIKDGRYRSQKIRIMEEMRRRNVDISRVIYLIENKSNSFADNKGLPISTLKSAMVNMQTRDGFRIYQTDNLNDTLVFLEKTIRCLQKYGFNSSTKQKQLENIILAGGISVKKNKNLTPKITYIHQLCIIPGISLKTANSIAKLYPSFDILINSFKTCKEKKEMLSDVKINQKRIGSKMSNKIYNYLFYLQ